MQHLYISSSDSKNLFPENTAANFTVELPSFLIGIKSMALLEFHCHGFSQPLIVFCDVVKSSYIANSMLPVLRIVNNVGEVGNVQPVQTTRSDVIRLTFKILDLSLSPLPNLEAVRLVLRVAQ